MVVRCLRHNRTSRAMLRSCSGIGKQLQITVGFAVFVIIVCLWYMNDQTNERMVFQEEKPGCLPSNPTERFMIYYCDSTCGGWSDRLDGIALGYVIANLTNRRFGIQIPAMSCSLTSFLEPNEVDWSFCLDKSSKAAARVYSRIDDPKLKQAMETADLDTTFSARTALLKANMDVFDNLKMNKLYEQKLSWMQPLTRDQIFVRIYKKLFKLSPRTQAAYDQAVQKARSESNGRLLCTHFRMGAYDKNSPDTVFHHSAQHGDIILKFLRQYSINNGEHRVIGEAAAALGDDPEDVSGPRTHQKDSSLVGENKSQIPPSASSSPPDRFFVASDSEEYISKAERIFGSHFVRTDGSFVHIDKTGGNRQAACDGFTKVLVDHHLLATCDVLVLTCSGFGHQAAYLRGRRDGLYCMLQNGTLVKCSPDKLLKLYHFN